VGTSTDHASVVARLRAAGCVFAEDEARLLLDEAASPGEVEAMVARRVSGEPLEYILGWAEFCGIRIAVNHGVFVPRRRTEALVREAAARTDDDAVVIDLCCGSGAVAVAIHALTPSADVYATDVDPAAVECARGNVEPAGGRVFEGDLFDALPAELRGRVSVVVANAPYVPSDAIGLMPPEARDHEHRIALDGGQDGTDVHRRIAAEAPAWLAPGGHLLIETGRAQAATTARYMTAAGLAVTVIENDELDATVVVGRLSQIRAT
jgi:release factor glutamine methyltransferase